MEEKGEYKMEINRKTKTSLALILAFSVASTFFASVRSDPGLGEFRWLDDTNIALCGQPEDNSQWDILISWGISSCINMLSGTNKDDVPYLLSQGLTYLHLPTIDWDLSPEETHAGVQWINEQLADGRKVLIHCYHGTSRTPTMAAMWYINEGHTAQEALDWIKSYPPSYPSDMATQAIYDYYDWLQKEEPITPEEPEPTPEPEPEPTPEPEPEPTPEPEPEPTPEPEPEPTPEPEPEPEPPEPVPTPVLATNISLSVDTSSTILGSAINVKGKITDKNGGVLQDSTVTLSYKIEGNDWIPIDSGITNTVGEYNIQWINTASGTFTLKVDWNGNDNYLGATNTTTLGFLPCQNQKFFLVESNSTISELTSNNTNAELNFKVSGSTATTGYVRATIPKNLSDVEDNWLVLLNDNPITPTVNEDINKTYIYFTYGHNVKTVEIFRTETIPELLSCTPLLITTIAVAAIIAVYRHNLHKQNRERENITCSRCTRVNVLKL
jgi:hypothetical protein